MTQSFEAGSRPDCCATCCNWVVLEDRPYCLILRHRLPFNINAWRCKDWMLDETESDAIELFEQFGGDLKAYKAQQKYQKGTSS